MAIASSSAAEAREHQAETRIDVSASTLPEAIAELSREARVSIGTEGTLPRLRTPALHGRMSVTAALARLLAGSGYIARQVGDTAWRIVRAPETNTAGNPALLPQAIALEPIIVTAAKRNQALADLPMAVAVIPLDDSRRADPLGGTARLAGDVEGLAVTGLGPGRNRMFLRGIADSAFNGESQSTVAVLLDDTRLTYSAPDPDLRLVDVERVEILKGPQGSLYGTGALGGIYHVVTRRAQLDETSLDVASGAEAVAHGDAGYSASAVANLPLAPGQAAVRLVGYHASEPGWIDTGTRSDSNSDRVLGARAGLGLDMGGNWRADLTGFAQWLETADSQYVYRYGAHSRPAQLAEPHDNDLRHLSARLAREAGGLHVVLNSGITWHDVDDRLDATAGADSFGLADPQILKVNRHYRVWDSEARVNGQAGGIRFLAGLSHVEALQNNLWTLTSPSAALVLDEDRRNSADTALFGDVTVPLTGKLSADAGARLFRSVVKETRMISGQSVSREVHRNGLTPSLALSWRPRASRLIYLRYGSAFRQGGTDIGSAGELVPLKSDELATIEAGWREQLPGGGTLDFGAHWSWWNHLQSDMLQTDGLIETVNAGNGRIIGAEISFEQPLGPGWRLNAGATYDSALLIENTLGYELDDRRLPVVPEYTLRGALTRDFRIGAVDASLRLNLRYLGSSRLSFDPLLDQPMGKVLESRIEGQAHWDGFDVVLAADNLFGRSSDTFAFGNPLRFATMRQYTPQSPMRLSLSIAKHF
ncbi:MAG: TonB-dependent receptor [Novosphingobium sp.]|nr:TonB-dependent receptor [Novosphingobium sp.]